MSSSSREKNASFPPRESPILCRLVAVVLVVMSGAAEPTQHYAEVEHYRFPTADELAQEWRDSDENRFVTVRADLNGDGVVNETWVWIRERDSSVSVYTTLGARKTLAEVDYEDLANTGIEIVPPGEYETACGKDDRECGPEEPSQVKLTNPGVALFHRDGTRLLFYWDGGPSVQRVSISESRAQTSNIK